MTLPPGDKVAIEPVPFIELVLTLVLVVPAAPAVVVVVVLASWASAVPRSAQAAPATHIFINLFSFMFVLWFG
jgi:hypothetical protein